MSPSTSHEVSLWRRLTNQGATAFAILAAVLVLLPLLAIFVYLLIALSELRLRRRLEREAPDKLIVRMWGFPGLTYVAIAGMIGILGAMAFIPDQRIPLIFGVISLGILVAGFGVRLRFGAAPDRATLAMEAHRYEEL